MYDNIFLCVKVYVERNLYDVKYLDKVDDDYHLSVTDENFKVNILFLFLIHSTLSTRLRFQEINQVTENVYVLFPISLYCKLFLQFIKII